MFDALIAGCIPVILSHDFVWPFTSEFDHTATSENSDGRSQRGSVHLNPADFSIRLNASEHKYAKFEKKTCERMAPNGKADLQSVLDAFSAEEIIRLRRGVTKAAVAYSYYEKRTNLPDNPLKEDILPSGGAAHLLIQALEERAEGRLWPECERELQNKNLSFDHVNRFYC
jgi:hypothetical protein